MRMFWWNLAVWLPSAAALAAGSPADLPVPGVDKDLFGELSPKRFLSQRAAAQPRCVEELRKARARAEQTQSRLSQLKRQGASADQLDRQEDVGEEARQAYHELMAKCGPCAVRAVEKQTVAKPKGTQIWYRLDGSCFVPGGTTEAEIRKTYEARRDSLFRPETYPKYEGGYPAILEFFPVDPKNGRRLSLDTLPGRYQGVMAIRGPELLGQQTAFGYFLEGTLQESERSGQASVLYRFHTVEAPRRFRFPPIRNERASGKNIPVRTLRLSDVVGQWYLTSDGYLRYTMAADLKMNLDFAIGIARQTLLDTLIHLSETDAEDAR